MTQETQPLTAVWLHSIIGMDSKEQGIRCQAEDCNHVVFRRIHVVNINGQFRLYGSTCFDQLIKSNPVLDATPRFQLLGGEARGLTEAERQLLEANTQQLLELIEQEYADAAAARAAELARLKEENDKRYDIGNGGSLFRGKPAAYYAPYPEREEIPPELWGLAKARVRAEHKIDPDQPGWHGLVLYAVDAIRLESAQASPCTQTSLL